MLVRKKKINLWRLFVNFLAFIGAFAILAFSGGLIYGKYFYPETYSSLTNPSLEPKSADFFGLRLTDDFITADLTPIPPLTPAGISLRKVSLFDPINKIVATNVIPVANGENTFKNARTWFETYPDTFTCRNSKSLLNKDKLSLTSVKSFYCFRPLAEVEGRISEKNRAYSFLYLFTRDDQSFIIHYVFPADKPKAAFQQAEKLMNTIIWPKIS